MSEFPRQRDPVESLNGLHEMLECVGEDMRTRPALAATTLRIAIDVVIDRAGLIYNPSEVVAALETAMDLRHSDPAKAARIINAVRAKVRRNARWHKRRAANGN